MDQVLAIPAPIVSAVSTEMGQASFAVDVMTMVLTNIGTLPAASNVCDVITKRLGKVSTIL